MKRWGDYVLIYVVFLGTLIINTNNLASKNEVNEVLMYEVIEDDSKIVELTEKLNQVTYELAVAKATNITLSKELETLQEMESDFNSIIKYLELPLEIQMYSYAICLEYELDYDLLLAIMHKESNGKINATNKNRNGTTDSGLMQINSVNHKWLKEELGITDFFNPYQNIRAGAYIIHKLDQKYDDVHQILMSYNMGESRMKQLNKQGIYSSKYSRSIIERMGN